MITGDYRTKVVTTLRAIEATVSADGVVTLDVPVKGQSRAILTLMVEEGEENEPDADELESMLEAEADRKTGNPEAFTSMVDLRAKLGF